eukprot:CAMPEP_0113607976 /NCGR_PEP_ID=MMETSP0017_2-20120614/3674_1 /TAXON_ID=2856 /ORGANISM="Cylindrotheca closterium" /LENGTH=229 /DNA_ID=CAMNT_0000516621 /DNA_START=84 /DNA_END=773 /DNA_ORIENTATION=+ /assembly_acc=CAM_ASM_000147
MSISNIIYLCILLIALSSRSASAFTGSQCLDSHPPMNRVSSLGKSFAASKSLPIMHTKDYAAQYHAPIRTLVQTEVATRDTNLVSRIIPSQLSNLFQFDKSKAASMGVAFAMTYNFISNINGSITLSTAWYIASVRTGLSPLVGGQWKSLMSAYGSIYLFVTLMKPLRFAMALSLTKHTERLIEETQSRLGCARPVAIGLDVAMGLLLWVSCMAGGVLFASALSGVPVY